MNQAADVLAQLADRIRALGDLPAEAALVELGSCLDRSAPGRVEVALLVARELVAREAVAAARTQAEVAARTGVSPGRLSRLVTGRPHQG